MTLKNEGRIEIKGDNGCKNTKCRTEKFTAMLKLNKSSNEDPCFCSNAR